MKKEEVNFQTVKVVFPKKLYLISVWMKPKNGRIIFFPLNKLQTDPKKSIKDAFLIYKTLNNEGEGVVLESAMITPLEFFEKIPLKKSYWENPSYKLEQYDRFLKYLDPVVNYKYYKLLVTPDNAKKRVLTAAIPFRNSSTQDDLETFMSVSDWSVDPEADCAAFYKMGETISINLITKEVYKKNAPESNITKTIN